MHKHITRNILSPSELAVSMSVDVIVQVLFRQSGNCGGWDRLEKKELEGFKRRNGSHKEM